MNAQKLDVSELLSKSSSDHEERESLRWATRAWSDTVETAANGLVQIADKLKLGQMVHFFTNGAWSQHELLIALTEVCGPCDMYVSTYAMSETGARTICKLKDAGVIKSLHTIIDNRSDTRKAESLQLLQSISTRCVLVPCHAKVTVLVGKNLTVTILGSANYTENNRIETGIATTNADAGMFHLNWMQRTLDDYGR